jgi:two-component system chemotaxis sensor kinase CheA
VNSSKLVETLQAKAKLLIAREREVFTLRLARERVMQWLQAFHRLSVQPDGAQSALCRQWTEVMVDVLHFQTAAAFHYDAHAGDLALIRGQSHTAVRRQITLADADRRLLGARREGMFGRSSEGDEAAASLAESLRLQTFLWFLLADENGQDILLVAGVAVGVGGSDASILEDDLVYFTMLGRHLAVRLSNAALIDALGAARSDLQELVDHMRQAIVSFDANGLVGGVSSRQAKILFERDNLEGHSIRDLLYPGAAPYDVGALAFDEWVEMVAGAPAEDWASHARYAPRDIVIKGRDGQAILLELEFRPLVRDGIVWQVMLLATDVSLERRLEQAVQSHAAQEASRIAAMRRLMAGGTQVFLEFVESARIRLDQCDARLRGHPQILPTEAIDELFRQVHTIRGEARAFDLLELESATQRLEEELDLLRDRARGPGYVRDEAVSRRLEAGIGASRQAVAQACEALAAAAPAGAAIFDQVTVPRSVLNELVEKTSHRTDSVGQLVARLASVPFGVTAAGVLESAPTWAASEGNRVVVEVCARELMIPGPLARVLPGALAHLVRNAIAHGIERPEERLAAGKPEHGTVRIGAEDTPSGVSVTVEDDGRGLDVAAILRGAERMGQPGQSVAELVFLPGLSTRQTAETMAGHGVGLDAVRRELACVSYESSVQFEPGKWTRFTLLARRRMHPSHGELQ